MGNRVDLHSILLGITENVYYQAPTNVQIKYPAIIYSRRNIENEYGSNQVHIQNRSYSIMVIDQDPDSVIVDKIAQLPFCKFDRHYISDGLNHDTFVIYY